MSTTFTPSDLDFTALTDRLRGELVRPTDPAYDEARSVYNAMIDKHPAAVARCLDVDDVRACVDFARTTGVRLAVRGGGHNAGGLGVWDDALVVDLAGLDEVVVDPDAGTVRVGGGCLWADVDAATFEHGLATPSGIVASTGVGGLALGGGVGYLSRAHGLTVDNLVSAEVVLADGSVVTASEESHPDLHWALRGGGGNLGVVTSFVFRCHPVGDHGTVVAGPVFYDLDETAGLLRWYRETLPGLPEDLTAWFGVGSIPPLPGAPEELVGRTAGVLMWCYTGSHDRADEALAVSREFGTPLLYGVQPMPYPALQSAFVPLFPKGMQWYWRADFFTEITDEAITTHLEYAAQLPTPLSLMHLYPIDGAAARVGEADTAFAYRDGGWAGVMCGVDPGPAGATAIRDWAIGYQEALHPTSAGGAYVNFLMDEGEDRVRASYRGNWDRLAQAKRTYDPDNLFRVNQNVRPAAD